MQELLLNGESQESVCLDKWTYPESFRGILPICKLNWDTLGLFSPNPSRILNVFRFESKGSQYLLVH